MHVPPFLQGFLAHLPSKGNKKSHGRTYCSFARIMFWLLAIINLLTTYKNYLYLLSPKCNIVFALWLSQRVTGWRHDQVKVNCMKFAFLNLMTSNFQSTPCFKNIILLKCHQKALFDYIPICSVQRIKTKQATTYFFDRRLQHNLADMRTKKRWVLHTCLHCDSKDLYRL